jgi:acyl carrier protein
MPSEPPLQTSSELNQLLDIIAKEGLVPRESLTPDSKLAELGIPSLEMINILFEVEDQLGVVVETEDMNGVLTIQDMMDLLAARLRAKTAPE